MPSWLLPARLHAGPRPSDNAHLDAAYAMAAVPIHSFHEVLLLVTLGLHLTSYTLSQSKEKSWSKRRSSLAALRCHERTVSGEHNPSHAAAKPQVALVASKGKDKTNVESRLSGLAKPPSFGVLCPDLPGRK
ncbi:hypothetical protein EV421DRAFT_2014030 [Armillaria borealis]|uniref:Uncharacterized protein n=1 Tax=Armillaria borealis TaxID=47425 RepID=A0AA39K4F5_9AGAR|nr:hypothetical protein EV421DRAFT_2014030 [Armillaria borealis]